MASEEYFMYVILRKKENNEMKISFGSGYELQGLKDNCALYLEKLTFFLRILRQAKYLIKLLLSLLINI